MKEIPMRAILTALSLSLAMPMAACSRDASEAERAATIPVTIAMAGQAHRFDVEVARTDASQVGLEVGTRTVLDVLINQQNLFNARQAYAIAKYNYLQKDRKSTRLNSSH